jgi:hypothetical protein
MIVAWARMPAESVSGRGSLTTLSPLTPRSPPVLHVLLATLSSQGVSVSEGFSSSDPCTISRATEAASIPARASTTVNVNGCSRAMEPFGAAVQPSVRMNGIENMLMSPASVCCPSINSTSFGSLSNGGAVSGPSHRFPAPGGSVRQSVVASSAGGAESVEKPVTVTLAGPAGKLLITSRRFSKAGSSRPSAIQQLRPFIARTMTRTVLTLLGIVGPNPCDALSIVRLATPAVVPLSTCSQRTCAVKLLLPWGPDDPPLPHPLSLTMQPAATARTVSLSAIRAARAGVATAILPVLRLESRRSRIVIAARRYTREGGAPVKWHVGMHWRTDVVGFV